MTGCGGPQPSKPAKPQTSTAVPRITPPPRRPETVEEAEPVKPDPAPVQTPAAKRPVGPWLQWQVASAAVVEGKGYLKLVAIPGYDSVLELTSYDIPQHEDYPSLVIRAVTQAKALADLLNKRLPAQLYIQVEQDGNLIHNLDTQPMEIVVTEIDGKNVRGTFSGQAHDVDSGGNGQVSGEFQAVIE